MIPENSYAGLILSMYRALLVDCARSYPDLTREFSRDFKRLTSAVEQHGVWFVLDVMPAYRKHLDKCLDERRLTASHLIHFGTGGGQRVIPRLFRGLTLRVFDRNGRLIDSPDAQAVRLLRQLLGVVRKAHLSCEPKHHREAVRKFCQVDSVLPMPSLSWDSTVDFSEVSASELSLLDSMPAQYTLEPRLSLGEELPKVDHRLVDLAQRVADLIVSQIGVFDPCRWAFRHGPGAVADAPKNCNKYSFPTWPDRLETVFPLADFAFANFSVAATSLFEQKVGTLENIEVPARMYAVPKTISKPRLIASEPTSLQWCQQSIRDFLYRRVQRTPFGRYVDFHQQSLNGAVALEASLTADRSTIDLSDASDRISCWMVERFFRRSPSLLRGMWASRSMFIQQDIDRVSPRYVRMRKYSTMGNATTFPVQSLVFLGLALASVLYVRRLKLGLRSISSITGTEVRVFGDDIVVPEDATQVMLALLDHFGMKVNQHKTFTGKHFRESCGVDAFNGVDVTTVSVLEMPVHAKPETVASNVSVHHNLCERGLINTARWIRTQTERTLPFAVRFVDADSGLFGWSSLECPVELPRLRTRYNRLLQRREVLCCKLTARSKVRPPNDLTGLLRYFTEASEVVTSSISSLGTLSQRPRVGLRLGWEPAEGGWAQ